jgi:hypothetical protein
MNGVGTWYWGKERIIRRGGGCDFCGRRAELSSFDTTLFFVVFFIPVIPLGRKRVLNQCSACKRHRVLSLAKWREAQTADITTANQAAMAEPNNEAKAIGAIGTAIGYQAREEFLLVAD